MPSPQEIHLQWFLRFSQSPVPSALLSRFCSLFNIPFPFCYLLVAGCPCRKDQLLRTMCDVPVADYLCPSCWDFHTGANGINPFRRLHLRRHGTEAFLLHESKERTSIQSQILPWPGRGKLNPTKPQLEETQIRAKCLNAQGLAAPQRPYSQDPMT